MTTLERTYTAKLVEEHCELQTEITGFWDVTSIQEYFDAVNAACAPLIQARKPIYALVSFAGFVPQDRATGDAIRDHLLGAVKVGLKRIAILNASPLTAMQYKRLSKGVDVDFFERSDKAIAWLRA